MEYIVFLVMFVTTVLMMLSRVRQRFQTLDRAVAKVATALGQPDPGRTVAISVPGAHPLSEEQIKDMAESRGFALEKTSSAGGSSIVMQFRRISEQGTHG